MKEDVNRVRRTGGWKRMKEDEGWKRRGCGGDGDGGWGMTGGRGKKIMRQALW